MHGIPGPGGGAAAFVDAVLELLDTRGRAHREEDVDQLEHALQAAADSRSNGGDDAAVVAALLHDIGHLVPRPSRGRLRVVAVRDGRHEAIAAEVLRPWLPPAVVEPIRLHVAAKRYLCAVQPRYESTLSAASIRSLEFQGGSMAPAEADAFAASPHAERAIALRRADDRAKVVGRSTPPLASFRTVLAACVARRSAAL